MILKKVCVPDCFLYEENNIHSGISDEIFSGWIVACDTDTDDGGFVHITTHYGYDGYVKASDLAPVYEGELAARKDKKRFVRLKRPTADLLKEDRVQGEVLETLIRGAIVEVLGIGPDYAQVRTASGKTGYIHKVFLAERKDEDWYFSGMPFTQQPGLKKALAAPDAFRKSVLHCARKYLGTQYRWGGKSSQGLDCSGLAFMSYMESGVLIWRDAHIQPGYPIRRIPFEKLQPADLIFFPGHVAIYMGNGKYIHSTGAPSSSGVVVNSFNEKDPEYRPDLVGKVTACGSIFPEGNDSHVNPFASKLNALRGNISFVYKNLNTGELYDYRAEEPHIAASIIKLFLMADLFDGFEKGLFREKDMIAVPDELKVPSCGVLNYTQDIKEMSVIDLITLMIIVSDNTACNLLFDYVGGADQINAFIRSIGIADCSFNRKMFDNEAARRGIENYVTAKSVSFLLGRIYERTLISEEASERMYAILKDQRLNGKIPFLFENIRPKVMIAHKTGEDTETTHDAGVIEGTSPFVVCFLGNDTDVIQFEKTMQEISLALYKKGDTV